MNYNLANAAPFINDSNNSKDNNNIKNKPTTGQTRRNVTFKNRHDNQKPKIKKEMIENIENINNIDNIDNIDAYKTEDELSEFLPNERNERNERQEKDNYDEDNNVVQTNYKENEPNKYVQSYDPPTKNKESFSKLESNLVNDYNKQFTQYQGSYQIPQSSNNSNFELVKKLDNILYLLEEQQEEKSNLVTEELILYVFLGIFVIYVLDSFVKVGKYTR